VQPDPQSELGKSMEETFGGFDEFNFNVKATLIDMDEATGASWIWLAYNTT